MATETVQRDVTQLKPATGAAGAIDAFADAAAAIARGVGLSDALDAVARATARATDADVVIVRVLEPGTDQLTAAALAGPRALAAELEGSRVELAELPRHPVDNLEAGPAQVRRAASRAGAGVVLLLPVEIDGAPVASLELLRTTRPFDPAEVRAAELGAAQTALVLRALTSDGRGRGVAEPASALHLTGDALAAGVDEGRTSEEITRLAATVVGAAGALLWRPTEDDDVELAAVHGPPLGEAAVAAAKALALQTFAAGAGPSSRAAEALPVGDERVVIVPLGQPPLAVLQLVFAPHREPTADEIASLGTFAVRAAHALRASVRARTLARELERTRALLAIVGQATLELSLSHTLGTAIERVGELLGVERLAVYLRVEGRLLPAAGRALVGAHVRVAEQLLELALGPLRGRAVVEVPDLEVEPRLAGIRQAAADAGIEAAVAVPLHVRDDVIGLLALYPSRRQPLAPDERELLAPLASQLAVAVQNAQLHEQAKQLGGELEEVLASEREAGQRLRALYEISRSFAQSLSLEATLDAVVRTAVDVLDVDAAVLRLPDARRELLVPRAIHVEDPALAAAVRTILFRPQPFTNRTMQNLFRNAEPFRLDADRVRSLGAGYELLAPFLDRGWTGAVVPVGTPAEVIATLSILSFRPGEPIEDPTVDAALAIAGQAALAIDNARLYQQQKEFADTMQRSLLPRTQPNLPGFELGEVYESSARVEVGGDIYDFMALDDGQLAVVLGDVTGHGVEATADMAMAKFVFRSLAREHPQPADFLAAANDVVVGEIASGKFITMLYLLADVERGEVAWASAGHPPPRVVLPDGSVEAQGRPGLVLGVEPGQTYEQASVTLPPGAVAVLFTDGVIEARRNGELYGVERLDALLVQQRGLAPRELAAAVVADCRSFAGGDLLDDCAVVVLRRSGE
jgi:serine phosphatase RsbU (regulator of sigma subunit)